ncbi:hypothetical protein [Nocardia harenae]|uniref:hypothetical protein n=1 Tax=Nocardia harenae TaxID=358707 RepID=UPI000A004257|nr:hypothetical protein [Nocardia harenae]
MADHTETPCRRRRRGGLSMSMLVAGLIALAISIWALAGPSAASAAEIIPLGWTAVTVAIVAGILLVLPRGRNKKD